ncbi:hypothetical protein KEM56_002352 [Ascosphaera pollenicola]|nr:hypothetical protein KEM56_002352 [Ascosphaera pollenicola]
MDRFAPQEISQGPQRLNLLMTPQIEVELQTWRETGQCPFAGIPPIAEDIWPRLSTTDLRLLHHILDFTLGLHRRGLQHCIPWGDKMLSALHVIRILILGVRKHYLMNAVLAFSARNMSWITRDDDCKALAHEYHTMALRTLQDVIRAPINEDVDAVLATLILLYWACSDLPTFNLIQELMVQIIRRLKPLEKQGSEFAMVLQGQQPFRMIRPQTVSQVDNVTISDVACLDYTLLALRGSCRLLPSSDHHHLEKLQCLLEYGQQLLQDLPLPPDVAFKRLLQLRDWILWYSAVTVESSGNDYIALAVLSQFYCLALSIEPIFPEIDAMFSASVVEPIVHIKKMVESQRLSEPVPASMQVATALMEAPCHVLNEYQKTLIYWLSEYRTLYEPVAQSASFTQPSSYVVTPTTDTYLTPPLLSPLPTGTPFVQNQACNHFDPTGHSELIMQQALPSQEAGTAYTPGYLETPDQEGENSHGYTFPVYPPSHSVLHDQWI